MRKDPRFLLWDIRGMTSANRSDVIDFISKHTLLDSVEEVAQTTGGQQRIQQHRLGDYFVRIELVEEPDRLCLLFERSPAAGRYWKDLMVHCLNRIQTFSPQLSPNLAYRGDELPSVCQTSG